jgi:hypothetical protein
MQESGFFWGVKELMHSLKKILWILLPISRYRSMPFWPPWWGTYLACWETSQENWKRASLLTITLTLVGAVLLNLEEDFLLSILRKVLISLLCLLCHVFSTALQPWLVPLWWTCPLPCPCCKAWPVPRFQYRRVSSVSRMNQNCFDAVVQEYQDCLVMEHCSGTSIIILVQV